MAVTTQRITPFLFEEASEAAGRPAGSVMVVDFQLDGQRLTAGGERRCAAGRYQAGPLPPGKLGGERWRRHARRAR